jgi:serine/threonine-protein kinase RsbW
MPQAVDVSVCRGRAISRLMSLLRTSSPPEQAVELEQWQLADADGLRRLRAELHGALRRHRLAAPEVAEQVGLVATELAGNALRHGRPPAIVRLLRAHGCFIVDVADRDLDSAPKLANAQHGRDGGRGLQIARSLSTEICWYATELHKHVWASFPAGAGF